MIGAIHRPQRITLTASSTSPCAPAPENRPRIGLRLRSRIARQEDRVDREQRRGERPVDDARKRLGVEQPHAAGDLAEVDHAVLVEDRIGDEVAERAAGEAIVGVRVGPELVPHHRDLRRVEIPAERAGDEAAEQRAEPVDARALHAPALAVDDPRQVEQRVDAGVSESADDEGPAEARQRIGVDEIADIGPPAAAADDDSARPGAQIAIGGAQAADERRRAVGRADQRLRQREGDRAGDRRDDARVGEREGDHAADAQRRRHGENEQHEHAAVDRAARRAAAEIGAHAGERRRPPAERVEREAGDEIDDAPQSRLGQRREQRAEEDLADRRGADLGEIGEQRRQRGEGREREDQRVQRRPPRQPTDADQRQQLQRRLVHDEQHDDAADEHFRRKRDSNGTKPPISAICQSAPSTTTSLNRNGTAARPSASIGRSGRASPSSAASDPPR